MRVTMYNKVKGFIEADKFLADSDYDLCWRIWNYELKQKKPPLDIEKMSARKLFNMLKNKKLPSEQAIRRSRRKCQELYPHTRGEVWGKRHDQQRQVLEDLGYK
tara:strand:- start:276 stop:587 length:312 start_codon:yes stop_codon:yes gene_type:complete